MLVNQTKNHRQLKIILHPKADSKNRGQSHKKGDPNKQQPKPMGHESVKIKKISELINKNVCLKKEISLNEPLITQVQKTGRKKKIDVSLSRQKLKKERSISEKSANKSTKLKISVNKEQSIRKIRDFDIGQEQNENITRIKTPRRIQDISNCNILGENNQNTNIINLGVDAKNQNGIQVEKRKIKICRNK